MSKGQVVANDTPAAVAATYGHDTLEGVFLELAESGGLASTGDLTVTDEDAA
jgi:hypothetical protein